MMQSFQVLVSLLVAMVTAQADTDSTERDVSSVTFGNLESFLSTSKWVYHMEVDLYKEDGSILFSTYRSLQTTDGQNTSTLATISTQPMTGFKQLNTTHVALIDYFHHCIKLLNRDNSQLVTFAGTCGTKGYVDGWVGVGKLYYPWGIELDARNQSNLLVTDRYNHALRSIDLQTGELGTVVNSGLYYPKGMLWVDDRLLVVNRHYISEISWLNNTFTNTIIAGSKDIGDVEGSFKDSRFSFPFQIAEVGEDLFLLTDWGNKKLKLLNRKTQRVGPVCFKSEKSCTKGSGLPSEPYCLLKIGTELFIGMTPNIYKLTGGNIPSLVNCSYMNITAYIEPGSTTAEVRLHSDESAVLSLGNHLYKYHSDICSYHVYVLNSPVIRTVVFRAQYDVTCDTLSDQSTKIIFQSVLERRRDQLQQICAIDCFLSNQKPWYNCDSNLLTVNWPTDKQYSMKWEEPSVLLTKLLEARISSSDIRSLEITILTHLPPVIPAKKNSDGKFIQIVLTSSCADDQLTYISAEDICA